MKDDTELKHPFVDQELTAEYVFTIVEEIKHKKVIISFQDWLISTINNLEAIGSTGKNRDVNKRYVHSTSGPDHPSELDQAIFVCEEIRFQKSGTQVNF